MIPTIASPPTEQLRFVLPVIRTKPGQPLKVVHLSESWVGINTHYAERRCVACPGEAVCLMCKEQPPIWKGFLVVRKFDSDKRGLLQITPNVLTTLKLSSKPVGQMAGLVVVYNRIGSRRNSPLGCQCFGYRTGENSVSFEDTKQLVFRLFKIRG